MIVYKDILPKLASAGYNTTRLRREKILSESVLDRLRHGRSISTDTLNRLCDLIGCKPEDLIEYVPDK